MFSIISMKRFPSPWRMVRTPTLLSRVRMYCSEKRAPASEQGEVASWADEEERVQERLRQRTLREVPRVAFGDRFRTFVESNNHPTTWLILFTGGLILYDILKPKNYHKKKTPIVKKLCSYRCRKIFKKLKNLVFLMFSQ